MNERKSEISIHFDNLSRRYGRVSDSDEWGNLRQAEYNNPNLRKKNYQVICLIRLF